MPIYEYLCRKCGEFEVTQRITEPVLERCPTCRSKVKKLISNTSFQLKGSGWYVTDYARKGNGSKSSTGGDSKSESATTSSEKESKKEGKAESKKERSQAAA